MRVAVICGGAEGVWQERRDALHLLSRSPSEVVTVAVNGAGAQHPDPLDHWATIHPEDFREAKGWEQWRADNGFRDGYVRWGQGRHPDVDRMLRAWAGGSSGLFAVGVALDGLSCDGVICCGIPMDSRANVTDPEWADGWDEYVRFRYEWEKRKRNGDFGGRVRSMSGWTRELLGEVTEEWLATL